MIPQLIRERITRIPSTNFVAPVELVISCIGELGIACPSCRKSNEVKPHPPEQTRPSPLWGSSRCALGSGENLLASEGKQVPRGIDDAEPTTVRGSGLETHTRFMQELVHQRLGKMFESLSLFRRQRTETLERGGKLRPPDLLHLFSDSPDNRDRSESRNPIPELLHF